MRLLARMDEQVSFEMTQATETLPTDFTFVTLLACMGEHVSFEMTSVTE